MSERMNCIRRAETGIYHTGIELEIRIPIFLLPPNPAESQRRYERISVKCFTGKL